MKQQGGPGQETTEPCRGGFPIRYKTLTPQHAPRTVPSKNPASWQSQEASPPWHHPSILGDADKEDPGGNPCMVSNLTITHLIKHCKSLVQPLALPQVQPYVTKPSQGLSHPSPRFCRLSKHKPSAASERYFPPSTSLPYRKLGGVGTTLAPHRHLGWKASGDAGGSGLLIKSRKNSQPLEEHCLLPTQEKCREGRGRGEGAA